MNVVDAALGQLAAEAEARRAAGIVDGGAEHRCPFWKRPSHVDPNEVPVQCVLWRDHHWRDHFAIVPDGCYDTIRKWGPGWAFIPEAGQ